MKPQIKKTGSNFKRKCFIYEKKCFYISSGPLLLLLGDDVIRLVAFCKIIGHGIANIMSGISRLNFPASHTHVIRKNSVSKMTRNTYRFYQRTRHYLIMHTYVFTHRFINI